MKIKKMFELPPPLQDGLNGVNKTNKPTNQQTHDLITTLKPTLKPRLVCREDPAVPTDPSMPRGITSGSGEEMVVMICMEVLGHHF